MSREKTYKLSRLVGESSESIEAATRKALATSAKKVRGQSWAHIVDLRARLDGGDVELWQVTVEVGFEIEEDD